MAIKKKPERPAVEHLLPDVLVYKSQLVGRKPFEPIDKHFVGPPSVLQPSKVIWGAAYESYLRHFNKTFLLGPRRMPFVVPCMWLEDLLELWLIGVEITVDVKADTLIIRLEDSHDMLQGNAWGWFEDVAAWLSAIIDIIVAKNLHIFLKGPSEGRMGVAWTGHKEKGDR